jgi:hypothetical protein
VFKTLIVQAQIINCDVYFKWMNMKLLNVPSNLPRKEEELARPRI